MSTINASLKVTLRSVYGNDTLYPACPQSRRICDLLGTKTLPAHSVRILKDMGFTFETVPDIRAQSAVRNALGA